MVFVNFQLFLTTVVTCSHLIEGVKYTITVGGETIRRNEDKITSVENAKKLIIEDEFEVFGKNLLEVREKTSIFIMDTNYKLKRIQSDAFVDQEITETIVIANSELKVIETGTFRNLGIFELILKQNEIIYLQNEAIVDLPNLEIINLSNNRIVEIFENSIISAPAIYLDMAFNRLKKVGPNWFRFMNSEKPVTILLDNNKIENVDCLSFNDVMLETLNLRRNRIEELPSGVFEGHTLVRVYLQDNRLENLPGSFFQLNHLTLGIFTGNPLDCPTQRRLKRLDEESPTKIIFQYNC
ncbi:follicle-stimulating hormone receptor-like [Tribolium madens]|uniref:follicle-stimulating hormone receptor-like n=1 Tax=Tribolium madens TaxID=41895 RepID=UPI001CF7274F|nr:follicle-stimulating hormone receptor-like [Tribolium madens]